MDDKKRYSQFTIDEFLSIENHRPKKFNAVVIVPTGKLHDSGWGCMKFIFVRNDEIVGVDSGWSDVLHINGIGGYGRQWRESLETQMVPVVDWSIDCLPVSGCLRLFCHKDMTPDDMAVSSYSIYAEG